MGNEVYLAGTHAYAGYETREEIKDADGQEPGRHDEGTTGQTAQREDSTARDSTRLIPDSG
jgi:hypothetical protein